MQMGKSKVFIGLNNIANISFTLSQALKLVNVNAYYVSLKFSDRIFNYKQEKVIFQFRKNAFPPLLKKNTTSIINTIILYLFFWGYLIKYNTFIFISPNSFLPYNQDLPILKFFGKKVITFFVGCEDRKTDLYPDNKEYICNRCLDIKKQKICLCDNIPKKALRVQYFEKYSDFIVSQDDSAGYLLKKLPIWSYVIADYPPPQNYLLKHQAEDLSIVHFPSNSILKLSHIIIPVLKRIARERKNIKLIIKEKIPHDEVLFHLEQANILVDALGSSYGVLAAEAMARGCIVVCGEMEFINEKLSDHPLIQATSNNLYEVIINLIDNKSKFQNLAMKSIDFYNQVHSPRSAGEYYKKTFNL
jgi:glycosyltransferase involved in cell wall biosynthesis